MAKKNKKQKTIVYKGFACKLVDKWVAPEDGGAPILSMPNVPHPLHSLAPRTILGTTTWNHMRNRCYFEANYTCEACGAKVKTEYYDNGAVHHQYHDDGTIAKRNLHAHELYSYDYNKGVARFERCVALCECCHVRFIHSGRMLTMYKQGDPLTTADRVLEGLEHGFKQIKKYNDEHKGGEKLRVYYAVIDYVDDPVIGEKVWDLIDKYNVEFYMPDGEMYPKGVPVWGGWKLVIGNKEYNSPFNSQKEWEEAMEKNNKEQLEKRTSWINRFKKYEGLDSVDISDDDMKKINDAKIPEGF
jgi:hypothetical protein